MTRKETLHLIQWILSRVFNCYFYFFVLKNRLGIPDLGIDERYQQLLQNYGKDIENVSRLYMKQKLDPPIGRDLPPVAGRILWARQLSSRIRAPMDLFQQVNIHFSLFESIMHQLWTSSQLLIHFQWSSTVQNHKTSSHTASWGVHHTRGQEDHQEL